MRGHQAVVGGVEAEQRHRLPRHEAMAGAVEAVAPHAVVAVQHHRQRVQIGLGLHGLVEGGVEHRDMRDGGQPVQRRADAEQCRRVVQRRERIAGFDAVDHAGVISTER